MSTTPEQAISTAPPVSMGLQIGKIIGSMAEAYQKLASDVVKSMQKATSMAEVIKSLVKQVSESLIYIKNWKPLIYVPAPHAVTPEKPCEHLHTDIDPYGYFILGSKTLPRIHSRTSAAGRILYLLLLSISEIVPYEEIQTSVGAGSRKVAFRNLKYDLKKEGFKLDYQTIRTEGIALKGIVAI